MKIRISPDLSLPVDVVTESIAILAKKRAGKSYLARKLVEGVHAAGQQVVVLDPKGDWWGIRSAANGKDPGLPFVIVGGEHADVQLEAGSGEVVADLVVRERASVLVDLSAFRKHEVATFCAAFLEAVYRLKARSEFQTPMLLVIDEADAIAPQNPKGSSQSARGDGKFDNTARMLGAAEDLVRRGGQRGIGVVLVSQRAAVLNKNVLTQTGILVLLKTMGSQDIDAIDAWISKHGEAEQRAKVMASLAQLAQGEAWWWAPGWPTERGIFMRTTCDPIETFDSGRTPKAGETRRMPKSFAEVDLDAFKKSMSATIERAKADDPKELRKQLAETKRELANAKTQKPAVERVEVSVLTERDREMLKGYADTVGIALSNHLRDMQQINAAIVDQFGDLRTRLDKAAAVGRNGRVPPSPARHQPIAAAAPPRASTRVTPRAPSGAKVGGGERKILTALAQYAPNARTKNQVAVLTGYAVNGGGFGNYLGALRSKGWIDGSGESLTITDAGLDALGAFEPLPVGTALLEHWMGRLGKAERLALEKLADVYPATLTKQELAERAGYAADGGGFGNALGKLRTLELIHGRAELSASDTLFGS